MGASITEGLVGVAMHVLFAVSILLQDDSGVSEKAPPKNQTNARTQLKQGDPSRLDQEGDTQDGCWHQKKSRYPNPRQDRVVAIHIGKLSCRNSPRCHHRNHEADHRQSPGSPNTGIKEEALHGFSSERQRARTATSGGAR